MDVAEIDAQVKRYEERAAEALRDADKLEQDSKKLKNDLEKQKERVKELDGDLRKAQEDLRELEKELMAETDKQTKYINIVLLNKKVVAELKQKKQKIEDEARRAK